MKSYYIDLKNNDVLDTDEVIARFGKLPWEIADGNGELVELSKDNGFALSEPLTPSEYAEKSEEVDEVITDDITIAAFDTIVADGYNLWNYPLAELPELMAKGVVLVVVSFKEGYRLVEVTNGIVFLNEPSFI